MTVGSLLILTYYIYKPLVPLWVGMLAHAMVDLLTHQQWAYNHFIPIELEPLRGVFSYPDLKFTVLEHTGLLLFVMWWFIHRRHRRKQNKTVD